ncbi:MAG: hypothetical protein MUF00_13080 [Gemmatimonadaceae bacterium]|jgi:hypothetical protein|nr:hypothetical protein [Gemmatimonadaceae bacterium]
MRRVCLLPIVLASVLSTACGDLLRPDERLRDLRERLPASAATPDAPSSVVDLLTPERLRAFGVPTARATLTVGGERDAIDLLVVEFPPTDSTTAGPSIRAVGWPRATGAMYRITVHPGTSDQDREFWPAAGDTVPSLPLAMGVFEERRDTPGLGAWAAHRARVVVRRESIDGPCNALSPAVLSAMARAHVECRSARYTVKAFGDARMIAGQHVRNGTPVTMYAPARERFEVEQTGVPGLLLRATCDGVTPTPFCMQ